MPLGSSGGKGGSDQGFLPSPPPRRRRRRRQVDQRQGKLGGRNAYLCEVSLSLSLLSYVCLCMCVWPPGAAVAYLKGGRGRKVACFRRAGGGLPKSSSLSLPRLSTVASFRLPPFPASLPASPYLSDEAARESYEYNDVVLSTSTPCIQAFSILVSLLRRCRQRNMLTEGI